MQLPFLNVQFDHARCFEGFGFGVSVHMGVPVVAG